MKATIAALEDVPEPIRGEYEPHNGAYRLKVEGDLPGFVPAQKHAEFRDNNVKLLKALGADTVEAALQRAGLFGAITPERLAALKDIDPAEYQTLKAQVADLEKKGVKKPDDVQTAIQAALDSFKAGVVKPLQDQLAAASEQAKAKDARLADQALRATIGERFTKAGGKADPAVVKFIVDQAKAAFHVVDDKVVAADGRYGANGDPLTVEEWIASATKDYAFAFGPSHGGGANPGAGGGTGGPKPGVKQLVNPTPEQLGQLNFVQGKGLTDRTGQVVEIVHQA